MKPNVVSRRAYAKVNLALSVGPPLPPGSPHAGYHPIASWMHCIDLFDEVTVRPLARGEGTRGRIEWAEGAPRASAIDWPLEKDLAMRAHAALERTAGRTLPVELLVRKRIPVGAGLGGGSSDAAGALVLLNEVFGLGLGPERLASIGHALGSDVPFLVDTESPARPAIVTRLGDTIERLARRPAALVLLLPRFGCATGTVYRAFDAAPGPLREGHVRAAAELAPEGTSLFNDLTPAAECAEPRLADLRGRAERAAGRPVHMSGSGSTLFALGGAALESKLRRNLPDVVVVGTRLV